MTKRLTPEQKRERKPTSRACTFCHSKHLQCSNSRPCQNCIKRKIAHECKDVTRKRVKYMSSSEAEAPRKPSQSLESVGSELPYIDNLSSRDGTPSIADYTQHMPNTAKEILEQNQPSLDSYSEPMKDSPASSLSTATNFNSNFLNQEYMMLGDLISKPPSPSSLEYATAAPQQLLTPNFLNGLDSDGHDTRPFISLGDDNSSVTESNQFNFDFSKQNENRYVTPLVSHHIYQTVQDIYSNKIIDFDYPSSYHSLTRFLKSRFSVNDKFYTSEEKKKKKDNFLKILRIIASYRPTFISVHMSLFQPFDFQFLEMSFQRCLLDYENLSRLNASPTIIWRRTGEIVSISNDLVNILGLNVSDILSQRTFIMELMHDDDSVVNYFRLFKSVAVGNLHSTIVTKCNLIKKSAGNSHISSKSNANLGDAGYIEFCSVWTVKRDLFDLPMMIVGHFLPLLGAEGAKGY